MGTSFSNEQREVLRTVLAPAMKSMRFGKGKSGYAFTDLPAGECRLSVGNKIFQVTVCPLKVGRYDGDTFFKLVRVA